MNYFKGPTPRLLRLLRLTPTYLHEFRSTVLPCTNWGLGTQECSTKRFFGGFTIWPPNRSNWNTKGIQLDSQRLPTGRQHGSQNGPEMVPQMEPKWKRKFVHFFNFKMVPKWDPNTDSSPMGRRTGWPPFSIVKKVGKQKSSQRTDFCGPTNGSPKWDHFEIAKKWMNCGPHYEIYFGTSKLS